MLPQARLPVNEKFLRRLAVKHSPANAAPQHDHFATQIKNQCTLVYINNILFGRQICWGAQTYPNLRLYYFNWRGQFTEYGKNSRGKYLQFLFINRIGRH